MQVLDILLPIVNCEYLLKKITELRKSERFTTMAYNLLSLLVSFMIFTTNGQIVNGKCTCHMFSSFFLSPNELHLKQTMM